MTDHATETLLRELLTGQARLETKVEALEKMPAQLESLRGAVTSLERQQRADLSNSYDRLLTKMAEHDAADEKRFDAVAKALSGQADRIDKLESVKDQQDGAKGMAGFIAKHAPFLFSLSALFAAALAALKDRGS